MNAQNINNTKKGIVKIIIEKSGDSFSAFAENVVGIYAHCNTIDETKLSIIDSIALIIKYNDDKNIPKILKGEYEIVYKFDTESFLAYYKKIFTNAALERMTGINQKQLQHYATGLKKPRITQVKKIETAIHSLAAELLAVQL